MYRCLNQNVLIPPYAEVGRAFKPGGRFAGLIQARLNTVQPFERGEDPIETIKLPSGMLAEADVVVVEPGETLKWGICRHHSAKSPEPSPFLDRIISDPERLYTDVITFELVKAGRMLVMSRAYAGTYQPPLPWMKSAHHADGGRRACRDYWASHAFLCRARIVDITSLKAEPPAWYAALMV